MSQDFANMPIDELRLNINSRRDKIFLLMEELRRLRIQQRLKVRACCHRHSSRPQQSHNSIVWG